VPPPPTRRQVLTSALAVQRARARGKVSADGLLVRGGRRAGSADPAGRTVILGGGAPRPATAASSPRLSPREVRGRASRPQSAPLGALVGDLTHGGAANGRGGRRGIALLEAGLRPLPAARGGFLAGLHGIPDTLAPYLDVPPEPTPGFVFDGYNGAAAIPEWSKAPRRTLRKVHRVYGQQLRRGFSPPRYREFEHKQI